MSILESIVLGIVQGLTEFLPVSSTGHLVLLEKIFGISNPMFLDTMLHLGTLIAVVIVLWREILDLFKKPFLNLWYLVVATIPAVIVALLLSNIIDESIEGNFLGFEFLFTALLLILAELIASSVRRKKELKTGAALTMGVMQAVGGIFAAVSRSGATIAGGLAYGVDRESVAKFSFLMSIPAIIGANLLQGYKVLKSNVDIQWGPAIIGTVCAAIAGYIAIKFMLALIRRKKLYGFAIYVALLGAFVLLDLYALHLLNW
jgi:undecaprenyl-diphosphatase